jgi:hypothetical protein
MLLVFSYSLLLLLLLKEKKKQSPDKEKDDIHFREIRLTFFLSFIQTIESKLFTKENWNYL